MVTMNITSNLKEVEQQLGDIGKRQIPFAASMAMNATMKDVQRTLRGKTFAQAWTNRNKSFTKAATTITKRASKRNLETILQPARSGKSKSGVAGGGFLGRQESGAVKLPRGGSIAIPQEGPGLRRLAGGAIGKSKRPRANAKLVKIRARSGNELLIERQKRKSVVRYVLVKKAKGTARLRRYYPDAMKTIGRVMPGHWERAIIRAIKTAR